MIDDANKMIVGYVVCVLLLVLAVLMLAGCQRTSGGRYERKETPEGVTTTVEGPTTEGMNGAHELAPVEIKADGSVQFGGGSIEASIKSLHGSPILVYIGAGVIIIATMIGWLVGRLMIALIGIMLGASLIGLAYYPWIGGIAAGVAVLSGGVYVILALLDARRDRRALEEVVTSVDLAVPEATKKGVMSKVQSQSTEDRVKDIKKRRGK